MLHSEKRTDGKGSAVALGYFDGIHLGHRAVLHKALEAAREKGLVPTVLLFDVHPKLLIEGVAPPAINIQEKKRQLLRDMGFTVADFDFSAAMNLSPNDFIEKILIDRLNARFVSCGYDFHYGKGGKGDAKSLHDELEKRKIDSVSLQPVVLEGEVISSTLIRSLIEGGEIEKANRMLGSAFSYDFPVCRGDGLGKSFGFPTMNQLFPENFIVPLYGVYVSKVSIEGKEYAAVTNIGVRPTVDGKSLRSETCILGYSGDLYGKSVEVSLLSYLRGEVKFPCFDALKEQIGKDAERAKIIYNEVMKMAKLDVKAIFFDFDDTLQSRKGAYRLYCEAFLTKYFPDISAEERLRKLDEMEEYVDGGYKDREVYFPEIIDLWKWENHPPLQELYDSFNFDFGKHIVMLDGAIDVLTEIKKRGYILGCITNGVSALQNMKLDTAGIRDMFDVVVVSGDIGIYKPDRRIFDEACRRAGVPNEKALFVGDHPINDIEGALGADMQAVRMNYGDFFGKGLGKEGVAAEITAITQLLDLV